MSSTIKRLPDFLLERMEEDRKKNLTLSNEKTKELHEKLEKLRKRQEAKSCFRS